MKSLYQSLRLLVIIANFNIKRISFVFLILFFTIQFNIILIIKRKSIKMSMTMTDHYRSGGGSGGPDRGGDRFTGDRDRGGFSSISTLGGSSGAGMQSSLLGFMAKPEMPLHLSILFRAR